MGTTRYGSYKRGRESYSNMKMLRRLASLVGSSETLLNDREKVAVLESGCESKNRVSRRENGENRRKRTTHQPHAPCRLAACSLQTK